MSSQPATAFTVHHTDSPFWRRYRRHHARQWDKLDPDLSAPRAASTAIRAAAQRAWERMAFNEYRAAATMSEVTRAMTEAQAPLDLTWTVSQFAGQELMHAHLCGLVASACATPSPGAAIECRLSTARLPVPVSGAQLRSDALVVTHLCVAETISLALLRAACAASRHKFFLEVLKILCRDEAVHSNVGWTYLAWAQGRWGPHERQLLAEVAVAAIADYRQVWDGSDDSLEVDEEVWQLCMLTPKLQREAGEQVVESVLRPMLADYGIETVQNCGQG